MDRKTAEKIVSENKCEFPNCKKQAITKFPYLCKEHKSLKEYIDNIVEKAIDYHNENCWRKY